MGGRGGRVDSDAELGVVGDVVSDAPAPPFGDAVRVGDDRDPQPRVFREHPAGEAAGGPLGLAFLRRHGDHEPGAAAFGNVDERFIDEVERWCLVGAGVEGQREFPRGVPGDVAGPVRGARGVAEELEQLKQRLLASQGALRQARETARAAAAKTEEHNAINIGQLSDVIRRAQQQLSDLDKRRAQVLRTMRGLGMIDDARLAADYPDAVGGLRLPTELFLLHLIAHTAYHLGQLDYHRRLVTGDARGVGALAIPALVA